MTGPPSRTSIPLKTQLVQAGTLLNSMMLLLSLSITNIDGTQMPTMLPILLRSNSSASKLSTAPPQLTTASLRFTSREPKRF